MELSEKRVEVNPGGTDLQSVRHRLKACATRGFSLIEMLLAIGILAVAVSALVVLIPFATQQNSLNRWDTAGMVYAQRVLEQMRAQGATVSSFTDQDGNTINMAAGGCPLTSAGNIDWGQPVSACGAGYAVLFTESNNPQAPRVRVRWNIQVNGTNGGKLVTISGRKTLADILVGRGSVVPAQLKLFVTK